MSHQQQAQGQPFSPSVGTSRRPPPRPATAADLWRLADEAERRGIKIYVEVTTGAMFASSSRDPGGLYFVDPQLGCTCQGYGHHARCTHFAAMLAWLGWLPDPDDDGGPSGAPLRIIKTVPEVVQWLELRGIPVTPAKAVA